MLFARCIQKTAVIRHSEIEILLKGNAGIRLRAARTRKELNLSALPFLNRVTPQDKATFLSQLSMMLKARVPIVKALELLSVQTRSMTMRSVIKDLLISVKKGNSLFASMSKHSEIFDQVTIVTAEVGQESGRLPEVLSALAGHMERMNLLRRKVTQALAYPLLVLGVAVVVVTFMLLYIVPTFASMFMRSHVSLPYATRVVISVSHSLAANWIYLLLALLLSALISRWLFGSDLKQAVADRYGLKVPWLGSVMARNYTARFCRTLGTLLQSQVPLVDALVVTKRIFQNKSLRGEIERLIKFVKQGRSVAEPLSTSVIFSPVVAQMIAVGEETSELDTMLIRVAEFYEAEISDMMETLTTVIEPIFIVFLGAIIGTILISMYLPMFDMANAVGGM
jgi:type IV pilus assembly protein PilC